MAIEPYDIKKLQYIENYFFDHVEDDFFYIVLHSLFNCISETELQVLYFEYTKGNPALKKTIESYIIKRTTNEPKRNFENVALTLLNKYPEEDYQTQVTTRVFLSKFIRTLSTRTIQLYFDQLIQSNRKLDRHRANEVADLIWNDEIEGQLIDNFLKYQDERSLLPLIENLDEEILCLIVKNYWSKEFPSDRIKSKIARKISKLDIDFISFLKERDVSYYIYILNLKKIKISDSLIQQLVKTVNEENKYYLIWTIGMTRNWKQITKYIEEIKKPAATQAGNPTQKD